MTHQTRSAAQGGMSVANKISHERWRSLLASGVDQNDGSQSPIIDLILPADTTVSDDHPDGEWVLSGKLKDGRFISLRASTAGIHAVSISTTESAVVRDLQRFKVAGRVGLVQVVTHVVTASRRTGRRR